MGRVLLYDRAVDDPAEMNELKEFHARLSRVDPATYEVWLNKGDASYELHKVYFTLLLMYAELEIENR